MPSMPHLFEPLTLRNVTLRNRIGISPMCTYSCFDGFANEWHVAHLGARAIGGAGLVMAEATSIAPDGRISPQDLGLWKDEHIAPLQPVTKLIREFGAVPAIQLAHAGNKAGTRRPWDGTGQYGLDEGGWETVGPSPIAFSERLRAPRALDLEGIAGIVDAFRQAARRSLEAGFLVAEIHAAHGYLLHQFLSPLSNHRDDAYGGSFENRTRLVREVAIAIREVWPAELPLFIRVSATDWVPGGWDIEQTVRLARDLVPLGVDLVDCSSGGATPNAEIPVAPGYQIPLAQAVHEAGVPSAAVGLITEPAMAEAIVAECRADMVLIGRVSLREPHWPIQAAHALGAPAPIANQYARGY